MKIYSNNIGNFLRSVKASGRPKSILLYGPDQGQISLFVETLVKILRANVVNVNYKESNNFLNLAHASNLFGNFDVLKITNFPSSIDTKLKDLLQTATHRNFLVFIADDLPKSSSFRKFFEEEANLAALACYYSEESNVLSIIEQKLADYSLSKEVINHIAKSLTCDRYLIENEVSKIANFLQAGGDKDKVISLLNPQDFSSADDLFFALVAKDQKKYYYQLDKLFQQDISPIWILRSLSRYFTNSLIIKDQVARGASIDLAIKSAKPPIFFKYINDFKKSSTMLSKEYIVSMLDELIKIEINFKSGLSGYCGLYQLFAHVSLKNNLHSF